MGLNGEEIGQARLVKLKGASFESVYLYSISLNIFVEESFKA